MVQNVSKAKFDTNTFVKTIYSHAFTANKKIQLGKSGKSPVFKQSY